MVDVSEKVGHVIYSNDHDLLQCLGDNRFVFSKSAKSKRIMKYGDSMFEFLKRDNNIPDEYMPLAMSVIGDVGDDVIGIKNIGPKRFIDCFNQLIELTGNMDAIYDKVENGKDLFDSIPSSTVNKYLKDIIDAELKDKVISNNLKLVSFELISRALDNPSSTEMIDKRKIIEKYFLQDREVAPLDSMKNALEMSGVFLEESSIDFLYI